jgi:hypothetical protein
MTHSLARGDVRADRGGWVGIVDGTLRRASGSAKRRSMQPCIDRGDVLAGRWVGDGIVDVTLHGASGRSARPSGQGLHHRREATSSVRSVEPNRGVRDATVDVTCIERGVGRTQSSGRGPHRRCRGTSTVGSAEPCSMSPYIDGGFREPTGGVVLAAVEQTERRGRGRMSRRRGRVTPRSGDHAVERGVGSATVGVGVRESRIRPGALAPSSSSLPPV